MVWHLLQISCERDNIESYDPKGRRPPTGKILLFVTSVDLIATFYNVYKQQTRFNLKFSYV